MNRRGFLKALGFGALAAPFLAETVAVEAAAGGWKAGAAVSGPQLRKLREGAGGTVGAYLWDYPIYRDPNVAEPSATGGFYGFGDFGDFRNYVDRTVGEPSPDYFRTRWRWDGPDGGVSAVVRS